jgi:hypothetical protein
MINKLIILAHYLNCGALSTESAHEYLHQYKTFVELDDSNYNGYEFKHFYIIVKDQDNKIELIYSDELDKIKNLEKIISNYKNEMMILTTCPKTTYVERLKNKLRIKKLTKVNGK